MSRLGAALISAGWTNKHTEDYGTIACGKRREVIATCTSKECSPGTPSKTNGARKNVSRNRSYCPDCGYALFWRVINGE